MREPLKDINRLEHMLASMDYIHQFMENVTFEEFKGNKLLYFAVIKNIEIIGEAAYMLSQQFTESHPATPWKLIKGMRHYLVHGYFQVNDKVVWDVVRNDLPRLRRQVVSYLAEEA